MVVAQEEESRNQLLKLLPIETGQAASRYGLHGDEICSAQENWNLTKEPAHAELLKLPALSHNILHHLEQALKNCEKSRILAFAYDPISAFNADICRLLCESLARGFVQNREEGYYRQFCRSDHLVVSPAPQIRVIIVGTTPGLFPRSRHRHSRATE
jgi:hypothetical protein